jgi:ATP-binding protein involved in chromosome partitioning
MFSNDKILNALKKVIHPGKGKDIVTLGMVTGIESTEKGISVLLEPDKPNDPFLSSIKSSVTRAIKDDLGPDAVVTEITVRPRTNLQKHEDDPASVLSDVSNIVAIASGKGGVGKTTIAVNLSIALARMGYKTGLLDADIFGPSVPIMFDSRDYRPDVRRQNGVDRIIPLVKYGVKVLSIGFFVSPSDAVVWRGPMASGFLKQMITQGDWGSLDYLLVDLPPGTSDIHLTLVQEVPVTGAIVVSTPQEVALADAVKGISMFRSEKINVPVLGLVENMSWFTPAELPENKYYIFGRDGCRELAAKMNVPLLGQIPLVQGICESGDKGKPVALGNTVTGDAFISLAGTLAEKVEERNRNLKPTEKLKVQ